MTRALERWRLAEERSFDALNQGMGLEGFAQDAEGAGLQGSALEAIFESRTDHDHGHGTGIIVQSLLKLNPAQSRHEDIGDDALADLLSPGIQKPFSGPVGAWTKSFGPHEGRDGRAGRLIIINDRNDSSIHDLI
jgi:hypothetical protein